MPKVIICIVNTQVVNDKLLVGYSASVLGPPNYSYGADYVVDINELDLVALKNKIINEVKEKGVNVINSDVTIFGISDKIKL
jgi:hypothetical protein